MFRRNSEIPITRPINTKQEQQLFVFNRSSLFNYFDLYVSFQLLLFLHIILLCIMLDLKILLSNN